MSNIKVVLEDAEGGKVGEYIINRLTVKDAIRRNVMFGMIESDDNMVKGQYYSAISLACSLCDAKGNLLYPESKFEGMSAVEELFELDFEVYQALSNAFLEINPIEPTLTAKKKKS